MACAISQCTFVAYFSGSDELEPAVIERIVQRKLTKFCQFHSGDSEWFNTQQELISVLLFSAHIDSKSIQASSQNIMHPIQHMSAAI